MRIIPFLLSLEIVLCRDFYRGMFKRDDYLVAQDNLFKAKRHHSFTQAEYGRHFKCPITYFRVVDRLGVGPGPTVKIIRGGLLKKYIVARIRSGYNLPISVNVYVGCENKEPRSPTVPWRTTKAVSDAAAPAETTAAGNGTADGNATIAGEEASKAGAETNAGGETTAAGAEPGGETAAGDQDTTVAA